jgi:hypothetical protein
MSRRTRPARTIAGRLARAVVVAAIAASCLLATRGEPLLGALPPARSIDERPSESDPKRGGEEEAKSEAIAASRSLRTRALRRSHAAPMRHGKPGPAADAGRPTATVVFLGPFRLPLFGSRHGGPLRC